MAVSLWNLAAVARHGGDTEAGCAHLREVSVIVDGLADLLGTEPARQEAAEIRQQLIDDGCSPAG